MNCPNCGKIIGDGVKFCPYCGFKSAVGASPQMHPVQQAPLNPVERRNDMKKPPRKGGKKIGIAVAAIVLALAVAGASVFFLFFNKSTEPELENAAQTGLSTIRGKIDTDVIKLDTASGISLAVYAVDIDKETGRAAIASKPVAVTQTDESGSFEVKLAPGTYIIESENKDGKKKTSGYRKKFTVPKNNTSSGSKDEPLDIDNLVDSTGSGVDTGFKHGELVSYNGVVYYADKEGLHRDNGSGIETIAEGCCHSLATDGETVYYTVYNKELSIESDSKYTFGQYDMYSVGADGKNKVRMFPCLSDGEPVAEYNDKLYYTDTDKSVAGNYHFGIRSLFVYDLKAKSTDVIKDGLGWDVAATENKLFVRDRSTDVSNRPLTCYNLEKEEIEDADITALSFYNIGNTLYYTQLFEDYSDSDVDRTHSIYSIDADDIGTSDAELLMEDHENFITYATDRYVFTQYSEYNSAGGKTIHKYYRCDILCDKIETLDIPDEEDYFYIHPYLNGVIFVNEDFEMYYADGDADIVHCFSKDAEGEYLDIIGDYVYTKQYSDSGHEIFTISRFLIQKPEAASADETAADDNPIDYSSYVGMWSDYSGDGKGYMSVKFDSIDENEAVFTVSKVGTHMASADVEAYVNGDTIEFDFTDSQGNKGDGHIKLNGDTISVYTSVSEAADGASYQLSGESELTKQND